MESLLCWHKKRNKTWKLKLNSNKKTPPDLNNEPTIHVFTRLSCTQLEFPTQTFCKVTGKVAINDEEKSGRQQTEWKSVTWTSKDLLTCCSKFCCNLYHCFILSGIFRLLLTQEIFPIIFMLNRPTDSNHSTIFNVPAQRKNTIARSHVDSHMVLKS